MLELLMLLCDVNENVAKEGLSRGDLVFDERLLLS